MWLQAMKRVDRDDDLADDDVVDQHRVGADRFDDRAGIGEPAGFEHDAAEPAILGATRSVADRAQQRDQLVLRLAAGAAAGEHGKLGGPRQQRIVDRRLRGLVDDDESVGKRPSCKLVAQPGRLARAEEPAKHRQPHPAVGSLRQLGRKIMALRRSRRR